MDIPETERRAFQEGDSSYSTWQQHRYDTRMQCLHIPYSIAQKHHGLDVIAYADVIIIGEEPTGSMRGVAVLQGVPFKVMKIFTNHWNYTSWQVCDYLQLLNGHVPECVQADAERKAMRDAWWQRHSQACTSCEGAGLHAYSGRGITPDGTDPCGCTENGICPLCGMKAIDQETGEGLCRNCGWTGRRSGDVCPPAYDACNCHLIKDALASFALVNCLKNVAH